MVCQLVMPYGMLFVASNGIRRSMEKIVVSERAIIFSEKLYEAIMRNAGDTCSLRCLLKCGDFERKYWIPLKQPMVH